MLRGRERSVRGVPEVVEAAEVIEDSDGLPGVGGGREGRPYAVEL